MADFFETGVNGIRYTGITGGNYYFEAESISLQGTGYYQFGKLYNGESISAYLASIQGFYNLEGLTIGGGVDYVSGNNLESESYNAFYINYGANHRFYGFIDHFTDTPNDTKGGGLIDSYLKLSLPFGDNWSVDIDLHNFQTAQNVRLFPNRSLEKNLANEIDLVVKHEYNQFTNIFFGGSAMQQTSNKIMLQETHPKEYLYWLWAMISVKPTIFSSE